MTSSDTFVLSEFEYIETIINNFPRSLNRVELAKPLDEPTNNRIIEADEYYNSLAK